MVLFANATWYNSYLITGLNGVETNALSNIQYLAGGLLTVSFLWSIFEAFLKGADVRSLGLSFFKYACVSFVVAYWDTAFRDVVDAFQYVASTVWQTPSMDFWLQALKTTYQQDGSIQMTWNLIIGGAGAALSAILLALGYIILPFVLGFFTLCYTLWGVILYVVGPLVVALMPSGVLGIFHRRWIENLFVWNCWPVLVSLFMLLMSVVGFGNPNLVNSGNGIMGFMTTLDSIGMLGTASLLIALFIATIPFTARKILLGEFGAMTALMLLGAAVSRGMRGALFAGGAGAGAGSRAWSGHGSGGGAIAASTSTPEPSLGGISPNCTLGSPPDTPPPSGETRFFRLT